jgi:hypothetical protein
MFLSVDGGHFWIYNSGTSQGAHRPRFLSMMLRHLLVSPPSSFFTLMMGAPDLRTVDVCYVDGRRSQISISTSQGGHHRRFLTLVVGAPGSPALAPPREPAIDIFYVDGGLLPDLHQHLPVEPSSMFLIVDGRRSRISISCTS